MKAVILAGGLGTRISEETQYKPKAMVMIGGKPIIWHILQHFSTYGINDFIICCGYKGHVLKEYFLNYFIYTSDFTIDLKTNKKKILNHKPDPWKVTLIDTGEFSQTGGRLKRIKEFVKKDKEFLMTYADGLSNVNIKKLINFHRKHKKLATVTAVSPPSKYGSLDIKDNFVINFKEKPPEKNSSINGGYFVLSPKCLDLISGDNTIWEQQPITELFSRRQLMAYNHDGFWQSMDTLREKNILEKFWNSGNPPWRK